MPPSSIGSLPLKWHGGKTYLAKWLIDLFPPHTHYVEPFFGGGSVLFSKPNSLVEGHSEVINDLNGELTNFWQVLRDPGHFVEFTRQVEATPFSNVEFDAACESQSTDPVQRAWAFFVRYRQSRQGLGTVFATTSRSRTRRGMNEQVSSWLSAVEGLPEIHARIKRVLIFNEDACKVLRHEDSPHTFFYLDPPYVHETRTAKQCYEFEMDQDHHKQLLDVLSELSGKFLLSGYPHPLYDQYAERHGWFCEKLEIDNKASSMKEKPIKTECAWMNYKPVLAPASPANKPEQLFSSES